MTASIRRVMRILGAAGLLAAPATASGRERPEWISRTPDNTAAQAYFVGQASDAISRDAGHEAAFKAAAAEAAAFIGSRVSGRLLSRRTTLESRISDEIRSSARGRLRGAHVLERYAEEPETRGGRAGHFVAVLLEFPMAEVRRERERLEKSDRELAERQDALCRGLAAKLAKSRRRAIVHVADFKESSSQQRRPFSRILEDGLRSCLSERGFRLLGSGQADIVISGDYWQAGQVEVAANAANKTGRIIASRKIRLSLDAVDPAWMTSDDDAADDFFSAPSEAAPRRAYGSVSVRSEPSGAGIFVDGVMRGTTPADIKGIEPGRRTIQLRLDLYVPVSQEVIVEDGAMASVRLPLRRQTGSLSLRSHPEGASIRVDGKPFGTSPALLNEIPTGRHEVSLELPDYKPWIRSVEIEYERAASLAPEMTKEDGALSVIIEPAGARIFLGDVYVGDSLTGRALLLSPIAAGLHSVRAEKEGRQAHTWTVLVGPRTTASVSGALPVVSAAPEPVRSQPSYPPTPVESASRMRYLNVLGAAFNGEYRNIRVLEFTAYGFSSKLGLGTSLVDVTRVRSWKTHRRPAAVSLGGPSAAPSAGPAGFSMVSFFPIKLYLAPLTHTYYLAGEDFVANLQLYSSFCFWALPRIDGIPGIENKNIPLGSVQDFGVLVHLGPVIGMRTGWVTARFPKFAFAGNSYSAFSDRKFYLAVDVGLGAFFANL